ncbi:MAG: spore coat associated protein CotJA [Ruminiclostridium sp.]
MNEMNMPYGNPYKDMSEMNMPCGNPYKDMAEKTMMPGPKMVLAMAYVPEQMWETPYEVTEGIHRGTLFPALDKPFLGGGNRL